ncbi:glycosyltransferase family 4 protein [Spirosoma agri]|nr:glycosyltransferase family 1 protein [Spirosoma agri]
MGYYYRKSRTGVSRVAERLLMGLWQREDVHLKLAASSHLPEAMRYAHSIFGKKEPVFINRGIERRQAMIENELLQPFPQDSLPSKVIRECFYQTKKMLRAERAHFDARQWPSGTIYHSPFYAIPAEIAACNSVQTVQTVYDLIPIFHPEWFPDGDQSVQLMLKALGNETQVVTVSEATKADLCNYTGIDPARVTPIHLAAVSSLFYPVHDQAVLQAIRHRYHLGDSPYFLSLATFEPRKNLDHLIRCFIDVAESNAITSDTKLVLVGVRGWKFDKIMAELAKHTAMRERIIVTGFVPDDQLAPLYSGALGFVYPSLYEGFGLPPLEAMQCGLPVIVSDIPSINEVVGTAGISVPPTDASALCEALVKVANVGRIRETMAAQSLQRAKLFSWETFIQNHVTLYERMPAAR